MMNLDFEMSYKYSNRNRKKKKLLFNIEITDFNIRNNCYSWEENAFKVLKIIDDQQQIIDFEKKYNLIEISHKFFVLLFFFKTLKN